MTKVKKFYNIKRSGFFVYPMLKHSSLFAGMPVSKDYLNIENGAFSLIQCSNSVAYSQDFYIVLKHTSLFAVVSMAMKAGFDYISAL